MHGDHARGPHTGSVHGARDACGRWIPAPRHAQQARAFSLPPGEGPSPHSAEQAPFSPSPVVVLPSPLLTYLRTLQSRCLCQPRWILIEIPQTSSHQRSPSVISVWEAIVFLLQLRKLNSSVLLGGCFCLFPFPRCQAKSDIATLLPLSGPCLPCAQSLCFLLGLLSFSDPSWRTAPTRSSLQPPASPSPGRSGEPSPLLSLRFLAFKSIIYLQGEPCCTRRAVGLSPAVSPSSAGWLRPPSHTGGIPGGLGVPRVQPSTGQGRPVRLRMSPAARLAR